MSAIDNGGPAFPTDRWGMESGEAVTYQDDGMTLRDWFAGQALPAVIAAAVEQAGWYTDESVASNAYALANAMLKERAK